MPVDMAPLFEPLGVRSKTLRNRIVMPPMVVNRGLTTTEGIDWYARRARGGVGLVIVEATSVNDFGAKLTPSTLDPLVEAVHSAGALVAIQLFPVTLGQSIAPDEITVQQIDEMVNRYIAAAHVCAEAGFDGVEPHGAHGYVLNQFFSPAQNRRTDDYGGSLNDRMRLGVRIAKAVRKALAPDMLLLYRHTPVGEGYGIADSLVLAEALVQAGVDVLDISPASADRPGDRAAPFKALGVPLIAVNELDRVSRALEVLRDGRADLIAIGRGLIADPDWPVKVRDGRYRDIVACVRCDDGCWADLRAGIPVACTQW